MDLLRKHKLFAKASKCDFNKKQVEFLSYVISVQGIFINPHKVKAIQDWPISKNISKVRAFLDLAKYYRKFVKNFSQIAAPLTQLLHKDQAFEIKALQEEAIKQLKQKLTEAFVLTLPNLNRPFIVTTNALNFAIRAVLSQDQGQRD